MRPLLQVLRFALLAAFVASRSLALAPAENPSNYIVDQWDAEDGLAQNSVRDILQTRDGYLWIATILGVSRFDGLTFTNFRSSQHPEIASNLITALAETPDGSVWIANSAGLARYHQGRFTKFSQENGLPTETVNSLLVAKDGSLWIGHREGITRWVDGRFVDDIDTSAFNLLGMREISATSDGSIWIAAGTIALRYVDGKFTAFGTAEGLPAQSVQAIRDGPGGRIVAATHSGLYFLENGRFRLFERKTASTRVNDALTDRDGNLWIGSAGGLERYSDRQVRPYLDQQGDHLNGVDVLFEDREGCLWVGNSSGLLRFTNRRAYTLGQSEGVLGSQTLAVKATRDGSVWVSSWSAGVARFRDGTVTQYRHRDPLSHDSITLIYEAPDGAMWFGNRGSALDRMHGDNLTTFVYTPGVVSARFATAMHIEPDGEILLSIANRGLLTIRDGQIFPIPEAANITPTHVWWIGRLRNGRLLAATTSGLFERRADRTWHNVVVPGFEPKLSVRNLLESENDTVWLCTDHHGLIAWRPDGARAFGTAQGMVDDAISSVLDDGNGFLWVTSTRGIARIRKSELDQVARGELQAINPITFGRADGLLSGSTPANSASPVSARLDDGRLMFATDKGVAVLDPASVRVNTQPPPIVIESVIADDQSLAITPGKAVEIPASANRIEFRYTALSLIAPRRLLFRYRLEGSDQTWIQAGRERRAHYTHLAPGSYTFEVLAANNDGIWSKTGAAVAITKLPHYYETLWFRILAGALLLAAIGGVVGIRVQQFKRRQAELARRNAELDRRVRERTAELSRSHAEIEQREMLFRLIFEHAPVGISWSRTDLGGRAHFNSTFRRILRLPGETVPDDSLLAQLTHRDDAPRRAEMEARIRSGETNDYSLEQRFVLPDGEVVSALLAVAVIRDDRGEIIQVISILEDITALKKAEQELANTYKRLVDASRMAGMAEVATGVLHNVGNVLNSVNVSATLLADGLRQSRAASIGKVSTLLSEHAANLAQFLSEDPKGQRVLPYLNTLAQQVATEQQRLLSEVDSLRKNVEHIKEVVARQQSYAQLGGLAEKLLPAELFEDALRINLTGLIRHGVEIVREFTGVPHILADRHKVLQILINLVQNAKQALGTNAPGTKRLVLRLDTRGDMVRFIVADNGVGIAQENLARIFSHGFTTRSGGHGFGLHSSANAAKEMRGSLVALSDGLGEGATFILELPIARDDDLVGASAAAKSAGRN